MLGCEIEAASGIGTGMRDGDVMEGAEGRADRIL